MDACAHKTSLTRANKIDKFRTGRGSDHRLLSCGLNWRLYTTLGIHWFLQCSCKQNSSTFFSTLTIFAMNNKWYFVQQECERKSRSGGLCIRSSTRTKTEKSHQPCSDLWRGKSVSSRQKACQTFCNSCSRDLVYLDTKTMPSGKIMLAGIERAQKCVIVLGAYISNDAIASAAEN